LGLVESIRLPNFPPPLFSITLCPSLRELALFTPYWKLIRWGWKRKTLILDLNLFFINYLGG
jgi:hypothetical protein